MIAPVFESVTTIIDQLANRTSVNARISMRYETLRLCTFRTYPVNKPFRIKLAKAGFYYASNGDEVICYCCAKRISNWRESDDPMNAHRLMSPNCSYLVRNSEVNVPVTSESYTGEGRLERILISLDENNINYPENRQPVISSTRYSQLQDSHSEHGATSLHQMLSDVASGINRNFATEEAPLDISSIVEKPRQSADMNNTSNQIGGEKTSKRTTDIYTASRTAQQHTSVNGFGSLAYGNVGSEIGQRIAGDAVPARFEPHIASTNVISYQPQIGTETQSFLSLPSHTGRRPKNPDNTHLMKEKKRLKAENQSMKDEITCKQCHKHDIEMVFLPCGHVITCESCGTKARTCFSCKEVIKGIAKFYSA